MCRLLDFYVSFLQHRKSNKEYSGGVPGQVWEGPGCGEGAEEAGTDAQGGGGCHCEGL